ncbi:uncharacterized protein B0T15DRAFT_499462, partial [Chaetomium strumarium]
MGSGPGRSSMSVHPSYIGMDYPVAGCTQPAHLGFVDPRAAPMAYGSPSSGSDLGLGDLVKSPNASIDGNDTTMTAAPDIYDPVYYRPWYQAGPYVLKTSFWPDHPPFPPSSSGTRNASPRPVSHRAGFDEQQDASIAACRVSRPTVPEQLYRELLSRPLFFNNSAPAQVGNTFSEPMKLDSHPSPNIQKTNQQNQHVDCGASSDAKTHAVYIKTESDPGDNPSAAMSDHGPEHPEQSQPRQQQKDLDHQHQHRQQHQHSHQQEHEQEHQHQHQHQGRHLHHQH